MRPVVHWRTVVAVIAATCLVPILHAAEQALPLPENPYALNQANSCGPRCLTFLDGYFRKSSSYSDVVQHCTPGPFGTNLQQVHTAATELGYHTAAFKQASVDQLKRLKHPAILHLEKESEEGHFLVVLGWNPQSKMFQVYNPPSYLGEVDADWIASRSSGTGLVVSDAPLPPFDELLAAPGIQVFDWITTALLIAILVGLAIRMPSKSSAKPKPQHAAPALRLLTIACLASTSVLNMACAKTANESANSADLHEVDFGRVLAGTVLKHTFSIINTSDQPLQIVHIHRACVCQAVAAEIKHDILPGASTKVSVEVPTEGREGRFQQDFVVQTTSKVKGLDSISLRVLADIDAKIKAIPSQIMFGTIEAGRAATAQLTVRMNKPDLGGKFLEALVYNNPHLHVDLRDRTIGMLQFDVTLDESAPVGDILGSIQLRFDDDEVPEVVLPVQGRKVGDLKVIPRVLLVNAGRSDQVKLRVVSVSKRAFQISDIEPLSGVEVDWEKDVAKPFFDIRVRLTSETPAGKFDLKIHTDQKNQPEIHVPCVARGGS